MSKFTYVTIDKSIEETSFEYITNLDDYKAMYHILEVLMAEKLRKPILNGIFTKITRMMKKTIDELSKLTKTDGKSIDVSKLIAYTHDKSTRKIILVKNEEYTSFASYINNFEDGKEKTIVNKTVLYNVGQLETSGSISVIPTNANVFLSSILYAYALLFSDKFYSRQNLDVMVNVAKLYYTVILSSFGKKSGLLVGAREQKEYLFFLTCAFIYSIYARDDKLNSANLNQFILASASSTGSAHLAQFLHKLANVNLKDNDDKFNPENFNTLFLYSNVFKQMKLLEVGESEIKIQLFKLLGIYGVMGLENYARFVAYILGTYIPNAYFASTLKVFNKASYVYLVEFYAKELFNF